MLACVRGPTVTVAEHTKAVLTAAQRTIVPHTAWLSCAQPLRVHGLVLVALCWTLVISTQEFVPEP